MIMENNYTRYSDELKKTDPTSPFYTEMREVELSIYTLQEAKTFITYTNKLINQFKTKLEELKRQQKLRETSDNFEELKKSESEKLKKSESEKLNEYIQEQLTRTGFFRGEQPKRLNLNDILDLNEKIKPKRK